MTIEGKTAVVSIAILWLNGFIALITWEEDDR